MDVIVVGVDGSTHADVALRWAVQQARAVGAELQLVHAYGRAFGTDDDQTSDEHARADAVLAAIVDHNRDVLDDVTWRARTQSAGRGSPARVLMDEARYADLVVVGSRGIGGFGQLLLGSTSYRLVSQTPTPVAVIRFDGKNAPDRDAFPMGLVVGVDASDSGDRALHWAADEARRRNVPLAVVHARPLPTHPMYAMSSVPDMDRQRAAIVEHGTRVIDRALTRAADALDGIDVIGHALVEPPAQALAAHSGERVVVIGNRGHSYVGGVLLGSVSHQVLHHATGPVVVVP
jgi:nucleotide-binding universal stress UspA family protein